MGEKCLKLIFRFCHEGERLISFNRMWAMLRLIEETWVKISIYLTPDGFSNFFKAGEIQKLLVLFRRKEHLHQDLKTWFVCLGQEITNSNIDFYDLRMDLVTFSLLPFSQSFVVSTRQKWIVSNREINSNPISIKCKRKCSRKQTAFQ